MKKTALILLCIIVVLAVGKNAIAGMVVSRAVQAITGLRLEWKLNIGIMKPEITISRMKLHNPAGFPDSVMVEIPEIYAHYDLGALLRGGVHLKQARVDLQELLVEKNAKGQLNIDSLKFVQQKKERGTAPAPAPKREFRIDRLDLRIGKVVYKDFSSQPPRVDEFPLNLNETYTGIDNPQTLAILIMSRALSKTAVARLTGFDLNLLVSDLQGAVGRAGSTALGAFGGLRKLIPGTETTSEENSKP